MEGIDEIIKEFLVESYESLDQLDGDLIALEESPNDRDRLASIFRTVHTIKGTSGFLALPKLERVAHVGENLLVPLRDGELTLNGDIADALLSMVDAIREILTKLETDGGEGDTDFEPLIEQLKCLLTANSAPKEGSAEEAEPHAEKETETAAEEVAEKEPTDSEPADSKPVIEEPVVKAPKPVAQTQVQSEKTEEPGERSHSVADATVRIDVDLLDKLMNLVGELVLARNQIVQFGTETEDAMMIAASQRLNLITTELQEGVMKTRMQPIRNAWSKLPRVVRDLSSSCGKKVEVKMEGADTELDKTILEAIKDPLTHIVRNSVDHGIESVEVREANGKPPEGLLKLSAFHEGGQVNIEISDDGGGIDPNRVRDKAVEKGVVTAEQAAEMNERELINLILLPGFSTAAKVTNVSGRGVGMDVVKTNIERIGGTLDIQSTPGKGTTLRIKIPLTLAIVPALMVKTGGDSYAIPQVSLLELVRLEGDRVKNGIEFIQDVPVYRLREDLLPLVYLDEQLELRAPRCRDEVDEGVNIVVLQAEDRQFGLVVNDVTDTQEIVVKPLGQHLKGVSVYAGATIMGDGTVSLILDVIALAQRSGVLSQHNDRSIAQKKAGNTQSSDETEALLIVDSDDETRAAVRLSTVSRLEEFDATKVERSGHNHVVQYRGDILPLIGLNGGCVNVPPVDGSNLLNTVVYSEGGQSVGVVVGKIVDIVYEAKSDSLDSQRSVIHDRVTEFVDLAQLVRQCIPDFGNDWSAA